MLFLVITTPRPERPSEFAARRRDFWEWLAPLQDSGECKSAYARVGRGAVALFDVDGHERLHGLLNQWSDIIPVTFEVLPLVDIAQAKNFLETAVDADGA